jgi:hypothetical protein
MLDFESPLAPSLAEVEAWLRQRCALWLSRDNHSSELIRCGEIQLTHEIVIVYRGDEDKEHWNASCLRSKTTSMFSGVHGYLQPYDKMDLATMKDEAPLKDRMKQNAKSFTGSTAMLRE